MIGADTLHYGLAVLGNQLHPLLRPNKATAATVSEVDTHVPSRELFRCDTQMPARRAQTHTGWPSSAFSCLARSPRLSRIPFELASRGPTNRRLPRLSLRVARKGAPMVHSTRRSSLGDGFLEWGDRRRPALALTRKSDIKGGQKFCVSTAGLC